MPGKKHNRLFSIAAAAAIAKRTSTITTEARFDSPPKVEQRRTLVVRRQNGLEKQNVFEQINLPKVKNLSPITQNTSPQKQKIQKPDFSKKISPKSRTQTRRFGRGK